MGCPKCNSNDIVETGMFDLTVVSPEEARHDFECENCGCLFQIIYHPVSTLVVEEPEEES